MRERRKLKRAAAALVLIGAAAFVAFWLVNELTTDPPRPSDRPTANANTASDPVRSTPAATVQVPSHAPTEGNPTAAPSEEKADPGAWVAFSKLFTGVVRDTSGQPVADAIVVVVPEQPQVVIQEAHPTPGKAIFPAITGTFDDCRNVTHETRTDAQGRYALRFSGEQFVSPDVGGEFNSRNFVRVVASQPGYLPAFSDERITAQAKSPFSGRHATREYDEFPGTDLTLCKGGSVSGRIVWQHSRLPVPGATVWARAIMPGVQTTGEGRKRYSMPSVPPIVCDADGRFEIAELPASRVFFESAPPGWTREAWTERDRFDQVHQYPQVQCAGEREAPTEPITITLPELSVLRFRLSPKVDAPVQVNLVTKEGFGTRTPPSATANELGEYVLDGLTANHKAVIIIAPGFQTVRLAISPTPHADLDLGTITLEVGTVLRGTVRDAAGTPLQGVLVEVKRDETAVDAWLRNLSTVLRAESGADGGYQIPGLEGIGYEVAVSFDGYSTSHHTLQVAPKQPDITLDVVLFRGGRVSGRVILSGGLPTAVQTPEQYDHRGKMWPPPQFVMLLPEHLTRANKRPAFRMAKEWYTRYTANIGPKDDDGTFPFAFDALAPGRYVALLHLLDTRDSESRRQVLVDVIDGETSVIEFNLDAWARVTGQVIGIDGRPMIGATIAAGTATARTDSSGRYEIANVPPGDTSVSLRSGPKGVEQFGNPKGTSHRFTTVVGESYEVDFNLATLGVRRLKVRLTLDGVPRFDEAVLLFDGASSRTVTVDSEGWIDQFMLATESVLIVATTPRIWERRTGELLPVSDDGAETVKRSGVRAAVTLPLSNELEVVREHDFRLGWLTITVLPTNLSGEKLDLTRVKIESAPIEGIRFAGWSSLKGTVVSPPDGVFLLPMMQGHHRIRASHGRLQDAWADVEVTDRTALTMQLGPALGGVTFKCASVSGTVKAGLGWRVRVVGPEAGPDSSMFHSVWGTTLKPGTKVALKEIPTARSEIVATADGFRVTSITGPGVEMVMQSDPENPTAAPTPRWYITHSRPDDIEIDIHFEAAD